MDAVATKVKPSAAASKHSKAAKEKNVPTDSRLPRRPAVSGAAHRADRMAAKIAFDRGACEERAV
jgi:hypothetical protein